MTCPINASILWGSTLQYDVHYNVYIRLNNCSTLLVRNTIKNVNYDQNKVHINGLKFNCYKGRSAGLKGEQKHRNE